MIAKRNITAWIIAGALVLTGCGEGSTSDQESVKSSDPQESTIEVDPMQNKGIGPISSLNLEAIDDEMAGAGELIFEDKCTACHKIEKKYIGPALKGVVDRRTPEWIMNMILNPEEMVAKDPIARQLLMEFSAPMANQNLTESEARKVLEYFRTK